MTLSTEFKPGDIVRVLETAFINGKSEKTGKYQLAEIVKEMDRGSGQTRAYKIETSARRTHRTESYLQPASDPEKEMWENRIK